ncbi:hypothetical protein M8O35_16765 [Enterobacter roggenkampii]|uniref:hypothetical protein n=1 Tax=Enterobacter roggenkampii TaxID=1812935 RepID=UPI0020757DAA|nr:hypothetical protein [Enterobacter roggenkampii]MCM7155501.1 hypothetical protein [Enterobacter roggenkampii]
MSNIDKEWLKQKIAYMEAARDEIPFGLDEDDSNTLAAMKLALASLEAEAVCVIDQSNLDYLNSGSDADVWPASRTEMGDVLLYRAAPPAPVSVPEWTNEQCLEFLSIAFRHAEIKGDLELDDIRLGVKMVNGSRAAMLQGADGNSPAHSGCRPAQNCISPAQCGNSPVIPDGWVLVPEEPTHEMLEAGDEQFGTYDVYRRMIAAAPQWKVK